MPEAGEVMTAPTEALRVNLARTAVEEVVIPPEHLVLLELVRPLVGVHAATEELLREVHHPYPGWPQALADLHRRATGDLHRYTSQPRGAEGIAVFCDLYATVARDAPDDVGADAIRLWLRYLEMVAGAAGGPTAARLRVVTESLAEISGTVAARPRRAIPLAAPLRRLEAALLDRPEPEAAEAADAALALHAASLREVLAGWAAEPDPLGWYREITGDEGTPPPEFLAISRDAMEGHAAEVASLARTRPPRAELAARLRARPDDGQVQGAYLAATDALTGGGDPLRAHQDQLHWLLRILASDSLGAVREQALRDAGRSCSALIERAPGQGPSVAIREVFGILREGRHPFTLGVQGLVGQIGRQALAAGDPDLADTLVAELLRLDFEYPDFSGFTSEWGVRVNPAHLRRLRTDLSLVQVDPRLTPELIAGLVVHLRLGGVFIADTDLFQRDVSALLAAPVGPVWLEVRQLLRLLPVYFNEIGAEGELRDVSTRLDEIERRRDPLCHFIRKQAHVECNPRLIGFVEETARYWLTGDPAPLARYVPASVMDALDPDDPARRALGRVVAALAEEAGGLDALLVIDPAALGPPAQGLALDPHGLEKVTLLLRVRREIARKYELDHADLLQRLHRSGAVSGPTVRALGDALADGDDAAALDRVLDVLEELQAIVLTPGDSPAREDIYRKRHIAAGIPSMYGAYSERRFEAMGLGFRARSLAAALLARVTLARTPATADRASLEGVAWLLQRHLRALRTEGFRARGLEHALRMLDEALADRASTPGMFLNILQVALHRIEDMIRARILDTYRRPIECIVPHMVERGVLPRGAGMTTHEAAQVHSERLTRDLVADSLGLSEVDGLVGHVIALLSRSPGAPARRRGGPPDVAASLVPLDGPEDGRGPVTLGNKGYMLRRLTRLGFRVPQGFVLTADLHRHRAGLWGSAASRAALADRVSGGVAAIARASGLRLGDPARPLLLSVRGGSAISMPGMLETLLNVGTNRAVVEGMARDPERAWAAWDADRRFLQGWGMAHGIPREPFDAIILAEKRRRGVTRKSHLPVAAMRRLAHAYRDVVGDHGAPPPDDPMEQLLACIRIVQESWRSERARLYRGELHIAEEWGTAVTVQRMVFGNLGRRSGTGVMLTRDPRHESRALHLYGDFVIQAQGDDVVSGLVATFPLTERQRLAGEGGGRRSLEAGFPEIHAGLRELARVLVEQEGMNHQEVEFTFESDRADGLYVLQTRDTVAAPPAQATAFAPDAGLEPSRIGGGIGAGGGALSGRVAHTADDIRELRRRWPDEPIVLLRRDTVPEDVPLVLQVDGLLTALGGATSHAAVAAQRLGKTCVVGCRTLDVSERPGGSSMGDHVLATGDPIAIDGFDGSVYLGAHPVIRIRVGDGMGGRTPLAGGVR